MNRKIKAGYYKLIGKKINALVRKFKHYKKRVMGYIKRLLFPLYLFPLKLLTYTLYYLLKMLVKFCLELAKMLIDSLIYPFRGVRNFIKSLIIFFLVLYLGVSFLVMGDYIYNEYGWFNKILCNVGMSERIKSSVVRVVGGYSEGSGFFVDEDTILTNFHVITGEPSPKIIFPDGSFTTVIKIVGDPQTDLALLDIDQKHPNKVLDLSSYRYLNENEPLIAVGYPGGTNVLGEATLLEGNYLTIRTSTQDPIVYIHTNINLAGGMSGGPLVDKCGQVIGINTAGISGNSFFISTQSYLEYKGGFSDANVTKINLDPSISPEEAVKAFYTYLKVRDMEAGFNLLSTEYLKNTNFEEWTNRFTDVIDVTVINTEPADWPPDTAFVKFGTKNWVTGEVYVHYYEGTWETVFEDGVYKMLRADIVEVDYPKYDWFWSSE